jgi:glycogen operon protein
MVAQIQNGRVAGTAGLERGCPWPLGAHFDGSGVNFALFSQHATGVVLCLFDEAGAQELARIPLPGVSGQIWHGYLPGAQPGLVYGYRVEGPFAPQQGHRFDSSKVLLDPYAREVVGEFAWHPQHFSQTVQPGRSGALRDDLDNGALALKARVCADEFDWQGDLPPRTPLADSLIYEVHVRGYTRLHPDVPAALRGTYAGLASGPVLAHLRRLGVTAINLLPVHHALDEQRLVQMGLRNYWAYNSIAFFAPNPFYGVATGGRALRDEFREMVRALHGAGIEVILDVVFNHTAESDAEGPTLSLRGIDNASYYRHLPGDPGSYDNVTGCGNALDCSHPHVLQCVMDSLRYWVQEMHVDGFRFDLAVTLGRTVQGFDRRSGFFQALAQDPILAGVKLIAEPWDIGPGGYQAGAFPCGWSEWNGRFRDGLRTFWLRQGGTLGELALRLAGSSDLFRHERRQPQAAINLITAHDGFTLEDLVSYEQRHNLANGEGNRDGHHDNLSWNCGVEGATTNPTVRMLRSRLKRALLACLLLSQGVPQLLAGDELGHSQQGNNNAYCQDGPLTWLNWPDADLDLIDFVAHVCALRRRFDQLRSDRWLEGVPGPSGYRDVAWRDADGAPLPGEAWHDPLRRSLRVDLEAADGSTCLLILVNGGAGRLAFALPEGAWQLLLDTHDAVRPLPDEVTPGDPLAIQAEIRSAFCLSGPGVAVLSRRRTAED